MGFRSSYGGSASKREVGRADMRTEGLTSDSSVGWEFTLDSVMGAAETATPAHTGAKRWSGGQLGHRGALQRATHLPE